MLNRVFKPTAGQLALVTRSVPDGTQEGMPLRDVGEMEDTGSTRATAVELHKVATVPRRVQDIFLRV